MFIYVEIVGSRVRKA